MKKQIGLMILMAFLLIITTTFSGCDFFKKNTCETCTSDECATGAWGFADDAKSCHMFTDGVSRCGYYDTVCDGVATH